MKGLERFRASPRAMLRALILATPALSIFSVVLDRILRSSLPEPLATFLESQDAARDWTTRDSISGILAAAWSLAWVGSFVGLWRLRHWGRLLYTATTIAGVLITPLLDPIVSHALAYTVGSVAITLGGVVLALIWFSNLSGEFSRAPAPALASGEQAVTPAPEPESHAGRISRRLAWLLPRSCAYLLIGGLAAWGIAASSAPRLQKYQELSHEALLATLADSMQGGFETVLAGTIVTALALVACLFAGNGASALIGRLLQVSSTARRKVSPRSTVVSQAFVVILLSATIWWLGVEADQADLAQLRLLSHAELLAVLTERNSIQLGIAIFIAFLLGGGLLALDGLCLVCARFIERKLAARRAVVAAAFLYTLWGFSRAS
jgi:hypothetical protein